MKLLIVGGQGMLGSMLATVFVDLSPTVWDRADIDITNADEVSKKITALSPTHIINAAAYTAVDKAEAEPEQAFAVNEGGVRNLALVAKKSGATLVHYSTDYVFPGDAPEGYSENDESRGVLSVYGQSKLAGERVLREVNPIHYLIRTAWLYGPGGKNFVDTMLQLAATNKKLRVVNDQHGSPTFTKDVAQATRTILEGDYTPGIYHTVNNGVTTWYEFAREIFKKANLTIEVVPIPSAEYPLPAQRPTYSILKNTRGPQLRPWPEALSEYLEEKR